MSFKVPPGETKRQRFVRVASRRTREAILRLRRLSMCANRGSYEYTAADVDKILAAIGTQVVELGTRFKSTNQNEQIGFGLEE